jgi:transcriptional regulator with XRE-family HTH domain
METKKGKRVYQPQAAKPDLLQGLLIGQKIKKLRELKNFTQSHVAEGIGLTQSAYSKMEHGETEVSYSKLEKVAGVLGMRPEDIISFNESMVFNVMHNTHSNNGLVIQNGQLSDNEKELYQDQIKLLKDEVAYLKGLLNKAMGLK